MKLNFTFTFLIIVSISCVENHDVTDWKGFTRYNFTLDQREARLVVPDHPLPGNPHKIVDLIKYHSISDGPLDASRYHQMRGDLYNCQTIFEQTGKGRVAFLGGSITYGSGWRDSICKYLVFRFPDTEFEFIPAGIPSMEGQTPSKLEPWKAL